MDQNAGFGVAPEATPAAETDEARMARLRAKAELQAATEFDEAAVYEKMLADARAARMAKLTAEAIAELPVDTQGLPAVYDKVKIFRGVSKHDLSYVPLGLNGLMFKVPRDEVVILPRVVIQGCLEHAVETILVPTENGYVMRSAHRFPFQTLGEATPAEYHAFQLEQRAKAQRELAQAA